MKTPLSAPVRVASTGEVTTIKALADAGRISWSTCLMDTKKRAGQRFTVRRYFADLIDPTNTDPTVSTGWEIGEIAYRSRTGEPQLAFRAEVET